jgi:predicted P-loop ATPase
MEAYMRRFLIAAVARALDPGCKVDTGLVLVGKQGAKKSTFFNTLFGDWYNDSPIQVGSKEAFILLNACWGYEVAELSDMHKATAEAVKQFMSSRVDTYRGVFAKWAARNPRQSVICASTNKPEFLVDDTGSRRFWPVTVPGNIDIGLLAEWRDQLWAEAVAWYRKGEQWWLTDEEEVLRKADAIDYTDDDVWERQVRAYLIKNGSAPLDVGDILTELELPIERQGPRESRRVTAILRRMGWSRKTTPQPLRSRLGPKSWSKD